NSFDVMQDRRTHVETEHRWKIRRLDSRIGPLAFERFDQARLFDANVGARAAMNVNIDIESRAEDVFAEKLVGTRLFDRLLEDLRALREFASYIYVRRPGVERETGDGDPFQELVRIFVDDVAVLKRARL